MLLSSGIDSISFDVRSLIMLAAGTRGGGLRILGPADVLTGERAVPVVLRWEEARMGVRAGTGMVGVGAGEGEKSGGRAGFFAAGGGRESGERGRFRIMGVFRVVTLASAGRG